MAPSTTHIRLTRTVRYRGGVSLRKGTLIREAVPVSAQLLATGALPGWSVPHVSVPGAFMAVPATHAVQVTA
jgi:hypothetical protein